MADQRVYARTFSQTLTLVAGLLCLEKRVSYRRLRKEFDLDDEILNDRRADIGFPGSRLRTLSRPWIGTLYGPPEVAGDQMVAAMDAVGVDGAILASPSACTVEVFDLVTSRAGVRKVSGAAAGGTAH